MSITRTDLGGVNVSLAFEQNECTVQEAWTANKDKTIARKVGRKPVKDRNHRSQEKFQRVYETTSDTTKGFSKTKLEKYALCQEIYRSLKS